MKLTQYGDIKEMQNEPTAYQMELNRWCLGKIVETLQFLARQGLAIREQGLAIREDNSDDDSNFMQILKLCSKDIQQLKDQMKWKQNRFMNNDIQNDIIQIMTNQITHDIHVTSGTNFI